MKKIKFELFLFVALILTVATVLLSGCKTAPADPAATADRVERLSYAAASIGTQVALLQNPEWRPAFEIAYEDLDQLVNEGVVTGVFLRNVLDTLPVKELKSDEARIAISSATILFDSLAGKELQLTNNVYVVAAAKGIRDGLGAGLGK